MGKNTPLQQPRAQSPCLSKLALGRRLLLALALGVLLLQARLVVQRLGLRLLVRCKKARVALGFGIELEQRFARVLGHVGVKLEQFLPKEKRA